MRNSPVAVSVVQCLSEMAEVFEVRVASLRGPSPIKMVGLGVTVFAPVT